MLFTTVPCNSAARSFYTLHPNCYLVKIIDAQHMHSNAAVLGPEHMAGGRSDAMRTSDPAPKGGTDEMRLCSFEFEQGRIGSLRADGHQLGVFFGYFFGRAKK